MYIPVRNYNIYCYGSMEYELSKRLVSIAEKENRINRRKHLAEFLSFKAQIKKAIDDGWSVKFIWETLHQDKKISVSYRMFLLMVKQHITQSNKPEIHRPGKEKEEKEAEKTIAETTVVTEAKKDYGKPEGFDWSNDYNVDDLI